MDIWDKDEFMSKWDKRYVSTNIKAGSRAYDHDFFTTLNLYLGTSNPDLANVSYALIAAACCALGRADVVGRLFDDITSDSKLGESQLVFLRLREAITIIFPYIGIPSCMPACYGMIGVVERKGETFASLRVLRKPEITDNDVKKGIELRAQVYRGVGNSEIFGLMDKYFKDLITCSTVVTWGYLIAKANEEVFQPHESHLIVATAIMALGATRQTKSHIKATLGIGNSIQSVRAVISVVSQIVDWADRPQLEAFDVDQLAADIQNALRA